MWEERISSSDWILPSLSIIITHYADDTILFSSNTTISVLMQEEN